MSPESPPGLRTRLSQTPPPGFPLGAVRECNHLLGDLRGQAFPKDILGGTRPSLLHDRQGVRATIVHLLDLLHISVFILLCLNRWCSVENFHSTRVPTLICAEGAAGLLKSPHAIHDQSGPLLPEKRSP